MFELVTKFWVRYDVKFKFSKVQLESLEHLYIEASHGFDCNSCEVGVLETLLPLPRHAALRPTGLAVLAAVEQSCGAATGVRGGSFVQVIAKVYK